MMFHLSTGASMNVSVNYSGVQTPGATIAVSVTAMCIVNIVAFVGNLSNLIVILKCAHLRHTLTNLFVLNLCSVDLLASILVLPVSIATFIKGGWPLDTTACTITGFINSLLTFSSITNLCTISIERYYSIRLPMHHAANMTLCRTLLVIVFIWTESVVFAALPLLGLSSYEYRDHKKHCSFTWRDGNYSRAYIFVIGFWCFLLPGVILLFMYYGIFKVARLAATQVHPQPSPQTRCSTLSRNPNGSGSLSNDTRGSVSSHVSVLPARQLPKPARKHFKAVKTLIVILTAYIVLWGPYFILHIHGAVFGSVVQRQTMEILTTWLGYVSFALNPFLYGWMNRTIREELQSLYRLLFCCMCKKDDPTPEDGPPGEDFWQFLERTSAKNNVTPPVAVGDNSRPQDQRDCDIENSELCF
ncbi:probable G-protein coupled receptor [Haliotis rufescens]|uniref:probable G-protein coupled receptor n=1 Tax=Haliotis rufescens TaxID=6454 RepID=UPI001EB0898E|nr:probable G-protein coupled receptor [Haliotis rufescens]